MEEGMLLIEEQPLEMPKNAHDMHDTIGQAMVAGG